MAEKPFVSADDTMAACHWRCLEVAMVAVASSSCKAKAPCRHLHDLRQFVSLLDAPHVAQGFDLY